MNAVQLFLVECEMLYLLPGLVNWMVHVVHLNSFCLTHLYRMRVTPQSDGHEKDGKRMLHSGTNSFDEVRLISFDRLLV